MDKESSTKQFSFFHRVVFAVIVKSVLEHRLIETGRKYYPTLSMKDGNLFFAG
jgi:hypothetical protein